jgi:hypothetical protein
LNNFNGEGKRSETVDFLGRNCNPKLLNAKRQNNSSTTVFLILYNPNYFMSFKKFWKKLFRIFKYF